MTLSSGSERLPRASRLKRRRLIRSLFGAGATGTVSVAVGGVRLVGRVVSRAQCAAPVQIGFAPGRHARNAVRRNRVKRILREVYRRHQGVLMGLFSQRAESLIVMVLFRGDVERVRQSVPRDLPRALERLAAELRSRAGSPETSPRPVDLSGT